MQVSQVDDQISHVVIGANQTKAMKFADTAELFNTFSSTLYSNGDRAAVREVMCNGWDSHIDSDCTDKPLQVRFDLKTNFVTLSFRDFGKGIPPELIEDLYGTYGGTTKLKDGRQTGGFGLGCKAPFAIVDDFEMINCHQGEKTIYRMSKSSGAAEGLPGITPIMTVPCGDQSGVEVKINIPLEKVSTFIAEVRRTALLGQIPTVLTAPHIAGYENGKVLEVLPYDKTQHNYLIIYGADLASQINVRLGNVVYPVDFQKELIQYDDVKAILSRLQRGYSAYGSPNHIGVIFDAPPNSLSITPSRESLKYSEHTINTLNSLFANFVNNFRNEYRNRSNEIIGETIDKTLAAMRPYCLVTKPNNILLQNTHSTKITKILKPEASPRDLATRALLASYPSDSAFRKRELLARVKALAEYMPLHKRGKAQSLMKAILRDKDLHSWAQQEIFAPLVTKLTDDPDMSPNKLYVLGSTDYRPPYDPVKRVYPYIPFDRQFHLWNQWKRNETEYYASFLRNYVVLAYSRESVSSRLSNHAAMAHWFHETEGSLVYLVQRSERKVSAAREFFQKLGYYIVDLTKTYAWDPKEVVAAKAKPKTAKKKGLALLSNGVAGKYFNSSLVFVEQAKRSEDFKYITRLPEGRIPWMSHTETTLAAELFGDETGVVVSVVQEQKYLDKGCILLEKHVKDVLSKELINDPDILQVQQYRLDRIDALNSESRKLIAVIMADPVLSVYYNIQPFKVSDRAKKLLQLWELQQYNLDTSTVSLQKKLKETPLHPDIADLAGMIRRARLIDTLGLPQVMDRLSNPATPETQKTKIRDILIHILKG